MEGTRERAYLTTGETAQRLGISKPTLRRAVQRGALCPAYRTPGGRVRFDPSVVETYARQLRSFHASPTAASTASPVQTARGA